MLCVDSVAAVAAMAPGSGLGTVVVTITGTFVGETHYVMGQRVGGGKSRSGASFRFESVVVFSGMWLSKAEELRSRY